MNTCPVDRSKFNNIKVYLHLNGKFIKEVSVIKMFCHYSISVVSIIVFANLLVFNYFSIYGYSTGLPWSCTLIQVKVDNKEISVLFTEDENTLCEFCHSMTDEDLLLLCDGCDRG